MTKTDDAIAQALNADDREFLETLEADRGLFRQLGDSWKGPLGGWAKLVFAFAVVLGGLLLFTIWQVAHTRDPMEHTLWAIAALAVLIVQGFIKEWMFARMNMLTILREVKHLQVQVALLSEKDK
ncbi:MAG: DUF6768 family protein [Erythrobacter sp.]|uniref:DUF6768 family protein n=1 Tax=Erythrobacter sp. Alg231-14 TaxID=1922225 RepID=UPI000D55616D